MDEKKDPKALKHKEGVNDIAAGIVMAAFAAWYFITATQITIPSSLSTSRLNAASVPELWGGLLFILGIVLIIRGAMKTAAAKKDGYVSARVPVGEALKAWFNKSSAAVAMFVVLFIYVALMNVIGFMLDTILFLFCEFFILTRKEERNMVACVVLALVFGVGIYVLFKYGFSMPLPQGFFKVF